MQYLSLLIATIALVLGIMLFRALRSHARAIREVQKHIRENTIDDRIALLALRIGKHDDASGGFWKMASGELIRVRDMSTTHIKNCIAGGFTKTVLAKAMLQKELRRREVDEEWSKKGPSLSAIDNVAATVLAVAKRLRSKPTTKPKLDDAKTLERAMSMMAKALGREEA